MKQKKDDDNVLSFEERLKQKRISELRKEVGARGLATQKAKRETEARRKKYFKLVPQWLKLLRSGEMNIEQVPVEFDLRHKIYRKLEDEKRVSPELQAAIDRAVNGPMPWDDDYVVKDDDDE